MAEVAAAFSSLFGGIPKSKLVDPEKSMLWEQIPVFQDFFQVFSATEKMWQFTLLALRGALNSQYAVFAFKPDRWTKVTHSILIFKDALASTFQVIILT